MAKTFQQIVKDDVAAAKAEIMAMRDEMTAIRVTVESHRWIALGTTALAFLLAGFAWGHWL